MAVSGLLPACSEARMNEQALTADCTVCTGCTLGLYKQLTSQKALNILDELGSRDCGRRNITARCHGQSSIANTSRHSNLG